MSESEKRWKPVVHEGGRVGSSEASSADLKAVAGTEVSAVEKNLIFHIYALKDAFLKHLYANSTNPERLLHKEEVETKTDIYLKHASSELLNEVIYYREQGIIGNDETIMALLKAVAVRTEDEELLNFYQDND